MARKSIASFKVYFAPGRDITRNDILELRNALAETLGSDKYTILPLKRFEGGLQFRREDCLDDHDNVIRWSMGGFSNWPEISDVEPWAAFENDPGQRVFDGNRKGRYRRSITFSFHSYGQRKWAADEIANCHRAMSKLNFVQKITRCL